MAFGSDTARYLEMTIILRAVNQTGTAFSNVALAATAMAAAIGAGLAYSVKSAADFQTGLVTLATGAGEARDKLQMVGDGVKQIAIQTATSTDDLLKGMFMIESGGYRAQDGLNVLKIAAEGSKAENADLGKTAFALTGLLHDYGMKSTQAAEAMNALIATESAGKMKMQDLTTSLGAVLPLASSLHISFPQIGAAIAVMTNSNMTAARASQNLNFALRALEAPGNTAIDAMTAVGLSADQIIKTLSGPDGLANALTLIEDHVGKTFPAGSAAFNTALKDIMGGATGWNVAVKLSGQHLQELEADTKNITTAMSNASAGVKNWDLIQSTFNFKLGQMQQGLNVAAIDLGTLLLPQLEKVLAAVVPIIGQFTNWVETNQGLHTSIENIGNFLAGTMVPALANGATLIGNFAMGAVHLYQAFQQGAPWAMAIATALGTIATVVAIIKIEETVTGWINWFNTMREGNGLLANLASKLLPELAQALGWQTVAEQQSALQTVAAQATKKAAMAEASASIIQSQLDEALATGTASGEEITALYAAADAAASKAERLKAYALMGEQAAAEEAVAMEAEATAVEGAALGMSIALGAATLGISLLVGAAIAGIAQAAASGKTALDDMNQKVYNSLGNTYDDAQAKQKAMATVSNATADVVQNRWNNVSNAIANASAQTKAKFILDQQAMADAAEKAAQRADAAWVQASQSGDIVGLLRASGYTGPQITAYLRQTSGQPTNIAVASNPNAPSLGRHASGIMNSPYGHFAMVGERGPELMYVPKGSNIYPHGTGPGGTTINVHVSTMAGSRAEVSRMVDLIERELAGRFRSQTPNFGYSGIV